MSSVTEDQTEILQLLYRYAYCFDRGDAHGWADLFTDDAYYDGGVEVVRGRDEIISYATRDPGHAGTSREVRRHVPISPVIDLDGDRAEVHSVFLVLEETSIYLVGTYEDEMVRTPKGWRFSKRICSVTAPSDYVVPSA